MIKELINLQVIEKRELERYFQNACNECQLFLFNHIIIYTKISFCLFDFESNFSSNFIVSLVSVHIHGWMPFVEEYGGIRRFTH